jgi:hypothetical protein
MSSGCTPPWGDFPDCPVPGVHLSLQQTVGSLLLDRGASVSIRGEGPTRPTKVRSSIRQNSYGWPGALKLTLQNYLAVTWELLEQVSMGPRGVETTRGILREGASLWDNLVRLRRGMESARWFDMSPRMVTHSSRLLRTKANGLTASRVRSPRLGKSLAPAAT